MARHITHTEARRLIGNLLARAGYDAADREMRLDGSAYIKVTQGLRADEITVYVSEHIHVRTDGQTEITYRMQVSLSCMNRTVAECLVHIENYRQAINLAAQIESLVQDLPDVFWVEEVLVGG